MTLKIYYSVQGEMVDNIEYNVTKTSGWTGEAKKTLEEAVKIRNKVRRVIRFIFLH